MDQIGYAMSIIWVILTIIYYYIKKKVSDKLFQDPPPKEDCSVCMIPMPYAEGGVCKDYPVAMVYQPCCGKIMCNGCVFAVNKEMNEGNMKPLCPFCRVPLPKSNEERLKRVKKRMELNDAEAFYHLGIQYRDGGMGLPQDYNNAVKLMNQAAELGSVRAHVKVAASYHQDEMGEYVDDKATDKGIHHWQLAAIGGHEVARFTLGILELKDNARSKNRAMKHFLIAAKSGYDESLKIVGAGFKDGYITKEEYEKTLRAYQHSCDEIKSEQRTKAMMS